jgi:hypothetical protein
MAAKAHLFIGFLEFDTGTASAQCIQHGIFIIAQAGHNSHTGNNNAFHRLPLSYLATAPGNRFASGVLKSDVVKKASIMPQAVRCSPVIIIVDS